jgi:16S rRNA (adenine1518-N6/adenine1519-N6)-dimethyltransferase
MQTTNKVKHIAKKRFGQNFLSDDYVINQIVTIISPQIQDNIVEIGPGLGALTMPILDRVDQLNVIEIDRDIISYLDANRSNFEGLTINEGDALTFDFLSLGSKLRVVGNLPYNISTPLLFYLATFQNIVDMHFMLQKEVVERICAKPGCGAYGRLSVMLQVKFECFKMLSVSKDCFTPKPQVESAIIRMIPKPSSFWQMIQMNKLNQITTLAFNQRRKTISNSLKQCFTQDKLRELGIDPALRAENLSVEDYILLSKQI